MNDCSVVLLTWQKLPRMCMDKTRREDGVVEEGSEVFKAKAKGG